ncbi:MAG: winged helix-turn-helix domain-containing protein [Saprospiraceae bacterium]
MRLLLSLLFVSLFFFSSAQINKDSLLIILQDESHDTTIQLAALEEYCMNEVLNSDIEKGNKEGSNNLIFFLLGILFTTILSYLFFIKKREKQNLLEREKLLLQIEFLEKKISNQPISNPIYDQNLFELNKEKIEKVIKISIGESSWVILNLIIKNPSISNKEIANEVSLSVEGVSSSLRRMYQAFDIKTSGNKKISLILKATRISFEN